MEIILFNNLAESDLTKFEVAIRCAYILCRRMGVYGKVFWRITDWEFLKEQPFSGKKEMLLRRPVPELLEDLEDAFNVLDTLRKIKHLTPQQLKLKNLAESNLRILEQQYIETQRKETTAESLEFYNNLEAEDENLYLSWLQAENVKKPFSDGAVSWVVDLRSVNRIYGPDIFWLDPDFFKPAFGFQVAWETELKNLTVPADEKTVRMMSLFRFPQLMMLRETELKYLRKEIAPLAEQWHNAFDPIIDSMMGHTKDIPSEEAMNLAIETGKKLEKALEASALVANQPEAQVNELTYFEMEVCLGYFPTALFWEYYAKQNFFSPETLTILENHTKSESYRPFTPVMVLKSRFPETEDKAPEPTINPTRKWIELD